MDHAIEIDEVEVDEESARLLRVVIGEPRLSRIELAAILARSFQQPGFLPLPVLEAFLMIAHRSARLPVKASKNTFSDEQDALLKLLQDGDWLDSLAERALQFEVVRDESDSYARDADVSVVSEQMIEKFGPLYKKLAK